MSHTELPVILLTFISKFLCDPYISILPSLIPCMVFPLRGPTLSKAIPRSCAPKSLGGQTQEGGLVSGLNSHFFSLAGYRLGSWKGSSAIGWQTETPMYFEQNDI